MKTTHCFHKSLQSFLREFNYTKVFNYVSHFVFKNYLQFMTSTQNDFFQYFDPSPTLEKNTLFRFQIQNTLLSTCRTCITNINSHLLAVSEEINNFMTPFQNIGIDSSFLTVNQSIVKMFKNFTKALNSEMQLNLLNLSNTLSQNQRDEFLRTNSEFQKAVDEYGNINPSQKPAIVKQQEHTLQTTMEARAEAMYDLCTSLEISEKTTLAAANQTFSTFFQCILDNMKSCVEIIESQIPEMEKAITVPSISDVAPKSEAKLYAEKCWETRRNPIGLTSDLSHPSGVIWFRTHHLVTSWTRKFMQFSDKILTIFDLQNPSNTKEYPLGLVTVVRHNSKKRRFCFKVQTAQDLIRIQALSNFDLDEWINIFNHHNSEVLGSVNTAPVSSASNRSESNNGSNYCCADCGAPEATWCSLNWCTHLCLKCSGIHRQMSTDKSKVRSILLDKLNPIIQDMLILITNNGANDLLLANPPNNVNIDPRMDEATRTAYLTSKYVNFEYSTSALIPDPFQSIIKADYYGLFHAMNFGKSEEKYKSLTPLHAAASSGNPLITAIAACTTTSVDVEDEKGWTPLAYAIFYNNIEVIKFLVDFGAQPGHKSIDLFTLIIAVGNDEVMSLLLKNANYCPGQQKVFKPISNKFAPEGKENTPEIVVTQQIKDLANLLYISEHTE